MAPHYGFWSAEKILRPQHTSIYIIALAVFYIHAVLVGILYAQVFANTPVVATTSVIFGVLPHLFLLILGYLADYDFRPHQWWIIATNIFRATCGVASTGFIVSHHYIWDNVYRNGFLVYVGCIVLFIWLGLAFVICFR